MKLALSFALLISLVVFLASIGYIIYLTVKKKPKAKAGITAAVSFIILTGSLIAFPTDGNKPAAQIDVKVETDAKEEAPTAKQQEQFLTFYKEYMGYLYEYRSFCRKYDKNINLASENQITNYEGYDSMNALESAVLGLRNRTAKMSTTIPEGFPNDCHEKVISSLHKLDDSLIAYALLVKKTKQGFNDGIFKPEMISEIKTHLQESNSMLQMSISSMNSAGDILGVSEKMAEIRNGYEFE